MQNRKPQKQIFEKVLRSEAVDAIFARIEKEHGSKVKRFVRETEIENKHYFTLILEDYTMLEVVMQAAMLLETPALEIEVEVW